VQEQQEVSALARGAFMLARPIVSTFRRTFLPTGYPSSVRKEYMEYQTWDTVQVCCKRSFAN
ncbi:unnamed protein product, partial [Hapterophycus canaliculatus]